MYIITCHFFDSDGEKGQQFHPPPAPPFNPCLDPKPFLIFFATWWREEGGGWSVFFFSVELIEVKLMPFILENKKLLINLQSALPAMYVCMYVCKLPSCMEGRLIDGEWGF